MTLLEFFTDYTFRNVALGTLIAGTVAGAWGSFAYLRKQSLMSDVISHAALPGALGAFIICVSVFDVSGRSIPALLLGASISGVIAAVLANALARITPIAIDTSMAIVMTLFFGAGMILLRHITNHPYPGKGGIQDYLFGNASAITRNDLVSSAAIGAVLLGVLVIFRRQLALRTFDPDQASVLGAAPRYFDALMFSCIVVATVVGLKSVGLVLMVAFVVSPPVAARQWTTRLPHMVALSAVIGALSSLLGAYLSIATSTPTGPVTVLVLFAAVVLSLLAAPERGIVSRLVQRRRAKAELLATLSSSESSSSTSGARA